MNQEVEDQYSDTPTIMAYQVISTDTILKASSLATEDIDEALKARFLSRLVREYRKNRERAK